MTTTDLLATLVAIPSISGEEEEAQDALAAWLEARGTPSERLGRNLVATIGEGSPELWLNSHMDTVAPAPGYTFDPWCAKVRGDILLGLGSTDAKGSVAALAAAFVARAANHQGGTLRLVITCDEETGGEGLEWVRGQLSTPDSILIGEPTDGQVCTGCKGLVRAEVLVRGQSAHASRPWEGKSAIRLAQPILEGLCLRQNFPEDPFLGTPTMEITMIAAGHQKNAIPARCLFTLDCRTTPAFDNAAMAQRLEDIVGGLPGVELRLLSTRLNAVRTPVEGRLEQAAHEALGQDGPRRFGGVCDFVHAADCDAAIFGPGHSLQSHRANEFLMLPELADAEAAYGRIIANYFGGSSD